MYRMSYLTLGQERWTTGEVLVGYQAHLGAYLYVYHGVCIQITSTDKSVRSDFSPIFPFNADYNAHSPSKHTICHQQSIHLPDAALLALPPNPSNPTPSLHQ